MENALVRIVMQGIDSLNVFTLVDTRLPMPPKKTQPNFKVEEFFMNFNTVSLDACDPGEYFSEDEKDELFTGRGEGTVRCKFKK